MRRVLHRLRLMWLWCPLAWVLIRTAVEENVRAVAMAGAAVVIAIVLAVVQACTPAELAAAGPLIQAGEGALVSLVTSEASKAGVSSSDPAYQVAVAAARALEAEQADAGAETQRKLTAILAEMKRARAVCPADAGAPLPTVVTADAGPIADGGR